MLCMLCMVEGVTFSFAALYFEVPGGRVSPTNFATGVVAVLVAPLAPDQVNPASLEDSARSDSACGTLLRDSKRPSFTTRLCDDPWVAATQEINAVARDEIRLENSHVHAERTVEI